MNLATTIFIIFFVHYFITYFQILFNKNNRENHKLVREKLINLRKIPVKTREEQLKFLDLKYPKKNKFKWSFKNVTKILLKLCMYLFFIISIRLLWTNYINFTFSIYQVLILVLVIPVIINFFLKKFGLERDDISLMLRWR